MVCRSVQSQPHGVQTAHTLLGLGADQEVPTQPQPCKGETKPVSGPEAPTHSSKPARDQLLLLGQPLVFVLCKTEAHHPQKWKARSKCQEDVWGENNSQGLLGKDCMHWEKRGLGQRARDRKLGTLSDGVSLCPQMSILTI